MSHQKNDNVFSMISHCDKHKINTAKEEKQLIKTMLAQKILSLIPKDKKKEYKSPDEIYYECPDCGKREQKPLHNSHKGLTRSNMLDYILRDHENNPKTISEYWNEFLEFHKYIEIAVCCAECNKNYEFDTQGEKEEELRRIVSMIDRAKKVNAETLLKEAKETYPDKFKEDSPKPICSDETNRDFEKFKSDNLGDDKLTLIIEAYDYVTRGEGKKLPTIKQAQGYKRYHEGIYEYISSDDLFDKIKNEQTRGECLEELENAQKKMKEYYTDKDRSNPKYSYPHAILGKLIKYCKI